MIKLSMLIEGKDVKWKVSGKSYDTSYKFDIGTYYLSNGGKGSTAVLFDSMSYRHGEIQLPKNTKEVNVDKTLNDLQKISTLFKYFKSELRSSLKAFAKLYEKV